MGAAAAAAAAAAARYFFLDIEKVTLCQLSGDQALKSTGENRAKALLGKSPLPFSGRLIGPKAPAVKPLAHREQPVAAG